MTAVPLLNANWTDQGTSFRLDVFCLALGILVHSPLLFVKFDMKGRFSERSSTERLMAIKLIEEKDLIKPKKAAPAPAPKKESKSLMDKLKELVKSEPPPPEPAVKPKTLEPKKIDIQPKEIKLEAKKLAEPQVPKIKAKEGFKTDTNPELLKQKKIQLNAGGAGVTPLTVKKLGIKENRAEVKSGKSGFAVAKAEVLSGIGGDGPKLAGASGPAISINTSKKGTVEKFSAAPVQKKDKGSLGDINTPGLNDGNLSLREKTILRDAKPDQIGIQNVSGSRSYGGGTAAPVKKDAGRFEMASAGSGGGGTGSGGLASRAAPRAQPVVAPVKVTKKKKEMFNITGPLKDRARIKQELPDYPLWAQQQGIEATVVLEFTVTPLGFVKDDIVIIRTSGYPKLDEVARAALRKWRFAELGPDVYRDEVGQITFNFQLN